MISRGFWQGLTITSAVLSGLLAVALVPRASGATLGTPNVHGGSADYGTGCADMEPSCMYVQTKIPGALTRAPFSGIIKKWRLSEPGPYSAQLVVVRKHDDGSYEAIRASDIGPVPSSGTYRFPTHLRIRKGDYIGLQGSSILARENSQSRAVLINSALELGVPKMPYFPSADTFLYNATLKRP
jgi:hypothetical protein